jgi:hypothetical protein
VVSSESCGRQFKLRSTTVRGDIPEPSSLSDSAAFRLREAFEGPTAILPSFNRSRGLFETDVRLFVVLAGPVDGFPVDRFFGGGGAWKYKPFETSCKTWRNTIVEKVSSYGAVVGAGDRRATRRTRWWVLNTRDSCDVRRELNSNFEPHGSRNPSHCLDDLSSETLIQTHATMVGAVPRMRTLRGVRSLLQTYRRANRSHEPLTICAETRPHS